jgi:tetratricopeptide (TPR) repeat protein
MQKAIVFGLCGLLLGLGLGFWGANRLNKEIAAEAPLVGANIDPASVGLTGQNPADIQELLDQAAAKPQDFVTQMKTGDLYAQIGRFNEAIEYYKRGVELKPNDYLANLVLANAYFDGKQFENAAKHYSKVLELKDDDLNARSDYGATFVERPEPDLDKALAEFAMVLEKDPNHTAALYYSAISHHRKEQKDKAFEFLAKLDGTTADPQLKQRLREILEGKAATQ